MAMEMAPPMAPERAATIVWPRVREPPVTPARSAKIDMTPSLNPKTISRTFVCLCHSSASSIFSPARLMASAFLSFSF
ncbi:MAG: hypothetical protein V3S49_02575 [Thermodesulfobacteriota bacterium]